MIDLLVIETKNGGDIVFKGNDFVTTQTFYNDPYFGIYGGNPAQNTTGNREENEPQFDWWGNLLIWENDPQVWINSRLENLLNNIALTSQSRLLIQRTVESDLEFMREFADLEINVTFPNVDKVQIEIKLFQPDTLNDSVFVFLYLIYQYKKLKWQQ
jgi:hypothetical protein